MSSSSNNNNNNNNNNINNIVFKAGQRSFVIEPIDLQNLARLAAIGLCLSTPIWCATTAVAHRALFAPTTAKLRFSTRLLRRFVSLAIGENVSGHLWLESSLFQRAIDPLLNSGTQLGRMCQVAHVARLEQRNKLVDLTWSNRAHEQNDS